MSNQTNSILLFLIGLGAQTQFHFVGSLGISEMPIFISAPFVFFVNFKKLRVDGFLPLISLALLSCVMCLIGGIVNHSIPVLLLKAEATYYSLFAYVVVLHRLLRDNLAGLKWLLIGLFFSSIISVFMFQQETYTSIGGEVLSGDDAIRAVVGNPLFWSGKISALIRLPIEAFYMSTPTVYAAIAPIVCAVIYILFSQSSGRAAAMISLFGGVMIIWGRKSRNRIRSLGRNVFFLAFIMVVILGVVKIGYQRCAVSGILGDKAREKYERQTARGTSFLNILMAGRVELFVCLRAALDKPLLGHGPRPVDQRGYFQDYLSKYGADEDYRAYMSDLKRAHARGFELTLPEHSAIASSWVNAGIVGLLLWLYIIYLDIEYIRKNAFIVPQWFGYIAFSISSQAWNIFFSGYGGRWAYPTTLVCILLVRAIARGSVRLPVNMEIEAQKNT